MPGEVRIRPRLIVIGAAAGEDQTPSHRWDVDDVATTEFAHTREDELARPNEPEDIRLVLAPHIIEAERLDRSQALDVATVVWMLAFERQVEGRALRRML